MNVSVLGIDLAKNVFQLHGVDGTGQVVVRRKVRRAKLLEAVASFEPCLVGMEACGSSHYWAREFKALGHDVRLISPQFVKPYVKSNKNDVADAEAICEAVARPHMRFVPVKDIEQQDIQSVHRARSLLVKQRTAVANQVRGLLGEYGVVVPQGIGRVRSKVPEHLEDAENGLSVAVRSLVDALHQHVLYLDERVTELERRLEQIAVETPACQRLKEIPGVGTITATALYAAVNHAKEFHNGRQMAAWLGLVPRQHSSGGKPTLLGICKRGDRHLRALLIHGARSAIRVLDKRHDKQALWLRALIERRGANGAIVALANKMARQTWVLLSQHKRYCNSN